MADGKGGKPLSCSVTATIEEVKKALDLLDQGPKEEVEELLNGAIKRLEEIKTKLEIREKKLDNEFEVDVNGGSSLKATGL